MIKKPAPYFKRLMISVMIITLFVAFTAMAADDKAVNQESRDARIRVYVDRATGAPLNGGPPILPMTEKEINALKSASEKLMQSQVLVNPMDRVARSIMKSIDDGATTVNVAVVFKNDATDEDIAHVKSFLSDSRLLSKAVRGMLFGTTDASNISEIAKTNHVYLILPAVKRAPANLEGGMMIGSDIIYAIGSYTGAGVKVAVNDTGITQKGLTAHPDINNDTRVKDQYDFTWLGGRYQANDSNGHGTHVTGIIGGDPTGVYPSMERYRGVSPDCDLYIYKILPDELLLPSIELYWALEKASFEGVDVVNNSWTNILSPGVPLYDYTTDALAADAAVLGMFKCTDCCEKPMTILFPAGNWQVILGAPNIADPGTAKNVITVGAQKDGNSKNDFLENAPQALPAFFTAVGPVDVAFDGATRVKPDILAPGQMTTSCWNWYNSGEYYRDLEMFPANFINGTSTAVAFATGAVANMLEAYSSYKEWPEMVKARTINRAVAIGRDPVWFGVFADPDVVGGGLLDNYHMIYDQMSDGTSIAGAPICDSSSGDIIETLLWVGSQFDWNTPVLLRRHVYNLPTLPLYTDMAALNANNPFYRLKVTLAFSDNPGYLPGITDCFNDLDLTVQWFDSIASAWNDWYAYAFPDWSVFWSTNAWSIDDNVEWMILTPLWNDYDNFIDNPFFPLPTDGGEFVTKYRVLVDAFTIVEPDLLGIFNNLPDGLPYSVEATVIYDPPNLNMAAAPSTQTVMPEKEFTISTTLSNTGYTAAGSWMSLTVPGAGFKVLSVDIKRADGEVFDYKVAPTYALPIQDPVREITRQGNTYTVYVGECVAGYDRNLVWHLKTNCCDYAEGSNFLTFNYGAVNWIDDTFINSLGFFMVPPNTLKLGNLNVEVVVNSTAPVDASFTLCPGINFLTLPLAATGINTEADLLQSFVDSGCPADAIFTFDCAKNAFSSWTILDEGASDPVLPGQPFFVNINGLSTCSWTVSGIPPSGIKFDLCNGFNAIGIPIYSTSLTSASDLMTDVPNADAAFLFTKELSCAATPGYYPFYTFSDPADDFILKPGHAYWVNVTLAGLWSPPNP